MPLAAGLLVTVGAYSAAVLSVIALVSALVRIIRNTSRVADRIDALEKDVQRLAGETAELIARELRRRNGGTP